MPVVQSKRSRNLPCNDHIPVFLRSEARESINGLDHVLVSEYSGDQPSVTSAGKVRTKSDPAIQTPLGSISDSHTSAFEIDQVNRILGNAPPSEDGPEPLRVTVRFGSATIEMVRRHP